MENLDRSPAAADRPRRGWPARSWIWVIPTTLLGVALFCGGCYVGAFGLPFLLLKSSEPYKMALQRVRDDPQVTGQLGEPIAAVGWFPTGEENVCHGEGDARLDFAVAGSQGKAQVHAEARQTGGRWAFARLDVTTEAGRRIVLDLSADQDSRQDAPLFQPAS